MSNILKSAGKAGVSADERLFDTNFLGGKFKITGCVTPGVMRSGVLYPRTSSRALYGFFGCYYVLLHQKPRGEFSLKPSIWSEGVDKWLRRWDPVLKMCGLNPAHDLIIDHFPSNLALQVLK